MRKTIFCLSIFMLIASAVLAQEAEEFSYDDKGKRDPFWPLITANGTILNFDRELDASDLIVQGIIADTGSGSAAIINDRVVQVGDMVGLYEVATITAQSVVLKKGDEQIVVTMEKEN